MLLPNRLTPEIIARFERLFNRPNLTLPEKMVILIAHKDDLIPVSRRHPVDPSYGQCFKKYVYIHLFGTFIEQKGAAMTSEDKQACVDACKALVEGAARFKIALGLDDAAIAGLNWTSFSKHMLECIREDAEEQRQLRRQAEIIDNNIIPIPDFIPVDAAVHGPAFAALQSDLRIPFPPRREIDLVRGQIHVLARDLGIPRDIYERILQQQLDRARLDRAREVRRVDPFARFRRRGDHALAAAYRADAHMQGQAAEQKLAAKHGAGHAVSDATQMVGGVVEKHQQAGVLDAIDLDWLNDFTAYPMIDPVIVASGITYRRDTATDMKECPMTRKVLPLNRFVENVLFKTIVNKFCERLGITFTADGKPIETPGVAVVAPVTEAELAEMVRTSVTACCGDAPLTDPIVMMQDIGALKAGHTYPKALVLDKLKLSDAQFTKELATSDTRFVRNLIVSALIDQLKLEQLAQVKPSGPR